MSERTPRFPRRTFLGVAAAGALAACAPNSDSAREPVPGGDDGSTARSTAAPGGASSTDSAAGSPAATGAGAATAQTPAAAASEVPGTTPASSSPSPSSPAPAGGPARYVANGARNRQQVALTFHCNGEVALANRLLDILKERSTPVTVFAVGSWLTENPALAARILGEGHELANHTWSHGAMRTMSAAALGDEITKCAQAIQKASGSIGPWFRPSQIEVPTDAILAAAGKVGYSTSVGYDVDSLDFQDPGAKAVRANVAKGVKGGSIVSLHFGHANTPEAMPSILDDLAAKALQPVTVTTLLS